MAKRKRDEAPEPAPAGDLLVARTEREQAWALARWMERRTFDAMRRLANLHPDEGGLGYDLSQSALKGLVQGARERRGDLTLSREDRAERRQAERDELARGARHDLEAAMAGQVIAYTKDGDALMVPSHVDHDAAKLLLSVHKAEVDEHGDAAATKIEATVVHRDAVLDELNAMMTLAGVKPAPTPERKD